MVQFKQLMIILTAFVLIQCSDQEPQRESIGLEKLLMKRLSAENVTVEHTEMTKITDGIPTFETYLLVSIHNSETFKRIKNNERIVKRDTKALAEYLLDSIQYNPSLEFEKLKLEFIEESGFAIFNKKNTTTFSYNVE